MCLVQYFSIKGAIAPFLIYKTLCMPKIILVTPTAETVVGSIKTQSEAFICAALLQALATTENFTYWVEFKNKGTLTRRQPDTIATTIGNCKPLYDIIRPLYINETGN
jgi:hypothetical protein